MAEEAKQYAIQCILLTKAQSAIEHVFKPLANSQWLGEIYVSQIKGDMGGQGNNEW